MVLQAPFDVFNIEHRDAWLAVKEQFYSDVALIEGEARLFIDASFKTLRSAEGAFEMLLNFRHIRSRDAINSQMMRKFNDILAQFDKEVAASRALHTCGLSPRIARSYPHSAMLARVGS